MKEKKAKQEFRLWSLALGAFTLLLAACGGDSGNNGTETEGSNSSSAEMSSSSYSKVAWEYLNTNITYGEMTDARDGQTYKTVVIGTQAWMAENLNYKVDSSWCYVNNADSCAKYGRLYQWAAAMAIDASYNSDEWGGNDANHRGVCPSGWHLPSDAEWTTLVDFASGDSIAGAKLKSTSEWYNDGNGTDAYGFSVLPAGLRNVDSSFLHAGYYAVFWSATESSADYAYYRYLIYNYAYMNAYDDDKNLSCSVRCVKN